MLYYMWSSLIWAVKKKIQAVVPTKSCIKIYLYKYCAYLINVTTPSPSPLLMKSLSSSSDSFPFSTVFWIQFWAHVWDYLSRDSSFLLLYIMLGISLCEQPLLGFCMEKQWNRSCRFTWKLNKLISMSINAGYSPSKVTDYRKQ